MGNVFFQFKQFTVFQDRCGMKVGTDGTLLGAWAKGGRRILDIGTGTGLIALMMAQRFPEADVTGIDIDDDACMQAEENVNRTSFRVKILKCDARRMKGEFDCIVSNPPFFVDSLECPDAQRSLARHTASLSYRELMNTVSRLLSEKGQFSLIIPTQFKPHIEQEAAIHGLFLQRKWAVRTTPEKAPKRYLLAYGKHPAEYVDEGEGILQEANNIRSKWYRELTKDFYLH